MDPSAYAAPSPDKKLFTADVSVGWVWPEMLPSYGGWFHTHEHMDTNWLQWGYQKGREKEMDVLGGLTVGEESGVQTWSRHTVYMYGTIKEKYFFFKKGHASSTNEHEQEVEPSAMGFHAGLQLLAPMFPRRVFRPVSETCFLYPHHVGLPFTTISRHLCSLAWLSHFSSSSHTTSRHVPAPLLRAFPFLLTSFPSCQPWLSHSLLWFALHMSEAGFQVWTSTSQLSPKA